MTDHGQRLTSHLGMLYQYTGLHCIQTVPVSKSWVWQMSMWSRGRRFLAGWGKLFWPSLSDWLWWMSSSKLPLPSNWGTTRGRRRVRGLEYSDGGKIWVIAGCWVDPSLLGRNWWVRTTLRTHGGTHSQSLSIYMFGRCCAAGSRVGTWLEAWSMTLRHKWRPLQLTFGCPNSIWHWLEDCWENKPGEAGPLYSQIM